MTPTTHIRRAAVAVSFVVVAAGDWSAPALAQLPDFEPNGRNSRLSWSLDLVVRDYPGPRGASQPVVGAEIVRGSTRASLQEARFRVGDIVERIGDVPVRGAVHFTRLWDELSSVDSTPVHVRRGGSAVVLRMTARAFGSSLDPVSASAHAIQGIRGHASRHFGAYLEELSPSLQECLNWTRGLLVADVEVDGPGDHAGLRVGDILVRINGKAFENREAANEIVGDKPGTLSATVVRNGKEVDLMPVDPAAVRDAARRRSSPRIRTGSFQSVYLLGLTVEQVRDGAMVMNIWPGSRGAAQGLADGDVITSVSGVRVTSAGMFDRLIREAARPSTNQLAVSGGNGMRTIAITLPPRRVIDHTTGFVEPIDASIESRSDGAVLIRETQSDGRSAAALMKGDRIVSVAGERAISLRQATRLVAEWPANQPLTLQIVRNDITRTVVVVPRAVEDRSTWMDVGSDFSGWFAAVELLVLSPAFAATFGVDRGVFVTNVRHGSNEESRGLRGCDVITQLDGQALPDPFDEEIDLTSWVRRNLSRTLTVRREGKIVTIPGTGRQ